MAESIASFYRYLGVSEVIRKINKVRFILFISGVVL